jgi:hypothetical protein
VVSDAVVHRVVADHHKDHCGLSSFVAG